MIIIGSISWAGIKVNVLLRMLQSVVGRTLRKTMTYKLGSEFCYKGIGNNEKFAFKETQLCSEIISMEILNF